ncbi:hypothetical protein evm_012197 [Chilo suppressalis]|nr:hypothetical protein evm_012197 [Chilo suppressalis]
MLSNHHHHHQPINVPTAGAQSFPLDGIGRLGHDPPRGPSADWWVLTYAAGTNGLTCLPKHGGTRDSKFLVTHPMTDHCEIPLMMGYVTRYVFGTDKLRPGAFEVRGARQQSTGVIHLEEPAALSLWLKSISDNILGLTNLQMKLLNRALPMGERIEYMGWVHEGVVSASAPWQTYRPKFLVLKGTDVMLYDTPPMNLTELAKCPEVLKVYQTMFRTVKESETVDWRQHCFLVQAGAAAGPQPPGPRYFSADTRRDLLRVEAAWTNNVVSSVVRLGASYDWWQHCFLVQAGAAACPRHFSDDTRRDLLRVEAAWTNNVVSSVVRLGLSSSILTS